MPLININKEIPKALEMKRHSLSHLLATAVQKLYPDAKLGIGPAINNGFYYDFDMNETISDKDLKKIEKQMKKYIYQNTEFTYSTMTIDEAKKIFKEKDETYKLELINELEENGETEVGIYTNGEWFDLCKGPHIQNTSEIAVKGFKLDKVSGAYWRGDENNKMMQRIYGLYFDSQDELKKYISDREDAKKRDHRNLGKELKLFMISEEIGKGLPMLLPRGATLRRILERWTVDEELKRGYSHVKTPSLASLDLYKKSTHWYHYKDSMYNPLDIDEEQFMLRPMTCPHHFVMYNNEPHSYRDLPVKYAEVAPLYRYEQSGELSGLIRLRNFTLADSHIICRMDQVKEEFLDVLNLVQYIMKTLGIENKAWYRASLRDPEDKIKFEEKAEYWDKAEEIVLNTCKELDIPYTIEKGEAAFYGPKIDVQLKNVYGKDDTAFTLQIDFAMPDKFDMNYINSNGEKERPVVIHRSSIGCLERTMAFLIEHYNGKFPLWLSPIQCFFIPISEKHGDYVENVMKQFKNNGLRCEADYRSESLSKKIREARLQRYPYIIICGDNEIEENNITIRNRDTQKQNQYSINDALNKLLKANESKLLDLEL